MPPEENVPSTPPVTPPATSPVTPPVVPPVTPPPLTPLPTDWKDYVPDATKTATENEALKLAHDATKPAEKPAAVVPLALTDIKLPEGFEADAPLQTKFVEILNDTKLSPADRANALVNLQAEAAKAMSERANAQWETFNTTLQAEVKADPTVGGAMLEANLAKISTLINTHGTPELRQVMDDSGAGNSVHVVKFLTKISDLLGEGKPAAGLPAGGELTQAERMYPSMKKG